MSFYGYTSNYEYLFLLHSTCGANGKEPTSLVNNQSGNARDAGEESSIPGREDPWRRKWQATPVFLSGKAHGQRRLVGRSPWGQQRVEHDWATEHARGLRSTRCREGDGDTYFSGTD